MAAVQSPSPYQYHLSDKTLFAVTKVMEVTCDEETCARWCMEVELIDKIKLCPQCNGPMKPSLKRLRWRCYRRINHKEGKEVTRSMLSSSFFSEAKVGLHRAVRLLLAWCMQLPHDQAGKLADVCARTVHTWYAFCRSTCSKELLKAEFKIGGDGHIVEIDETSLAKKRKYNRGKHYQEFWLFGGVERVTGRWFGRVVYDKRTKDTLLPIIKQFIKPRTKIMSDMFATYVCERGNKLHTLETNRMLLNMEYTHSWVNHNLNFVDPITGTHTNTIEGLWETRIKRHIKSMRGMTKKRLDEYLDEYM
ncbi:hypothetical protein F442_16217 [Phytophthora nicotianae P10297]|uniref:ISXO2-like transposase domain-containing protein n=1 Tax=Phytophthora nicotianae P10297 TaxID=1317064 RepID=W2YM29_PHYNI|nr:hypothetical protein F442_16217 [Phytophthora nicotianae P10297]